MEILGERGWAVDDLITELSAPSDGPHQVTEIVPVPTSEHVAQIVGQLVGQFIFQILLKFYSFRSF